MAGALLAASTSLAPLVDKSGDKLRRFEFRWF